MYSSEDAEIGRLRAEISRLTEAFEYHRSESARKGVRLEHVLKQLEELKAENERLAKEGPLNSKSFNTLLRLVGGMAMAVYGFEPGATRGSVVSDIQRDLDLKGINLDEDTIRKYLKQSLPLLRGAEKLASKPK